MPVLALTKVAQPQTPNSESATEGPMWGHPMLVLGALCSFLEPFRRRLSPNIDNVSEKLTVRYPHEGPWEGSPRKVIAKAFAFGMITLSELFHLILN